MQSGPWGMPLILASASPQRQRLLSDAGYRFVVRPAAVAEPSPEQIPDPFAHVAHAAWLKAATVARDLAHAIILAADTIVTLHGAIIGKPADRDHAEQILHTLSGSDHEVLTGVCVWRRPADTWVGSVARTRLRMRTLDDSEIARYLATGLWQDKAGAYGIQDADAYVSVVEGSFSNVVGLPMELVERLLQASIP
jgi:septum formation protein